MKDLKVGDVVFCYGCSLLSLFKADAAKSNVRGIVREIRGAWVDVDANAPGWHHLTFHIKQLRRLKKKVKGSTTILVDPSTDKPTTTTYPICNQCSAVIFKKERKVRFYAYLLITQHSDLPYTIGYHEEDFCRFRRLPQFDIYEEV